MSNTFRHSVRIERDLNYFSISADGFLITSPINDGRVQIEFCEDFAATIAVTIAGDMVEQGPVQQIVNPQVEYSQDPCRVLFGRVKLSLAAAESLRDSLSHHIDLSKKFQPPK